MRKISLLLVICLIASFAPITAKAKPYENYPFTYENFEDLTIGGLVKNGSDAAYEVAEGGYGNSRGSLKVTVKSNYNSVKFPVHMDKGITYTVSCRVKAGSNFLTRNASFVLYFKEKLEDGSEGTRSAFLQPTVSNINYSTEDWTEITATVEFKGEARVSGVGNVQVVNDGTAELRIGSGLLSDISGGTAFSYYLDDFYVQPTSLAPSTVEDKAPVDDTEDFGGLIMGGSFEGSSINEAWETAGVKINALSEGAAGTSKSIEVIPDGGALKQQVPLLHSHMYKLKCWLKGTEDSIGKNAQLVIDRTNKTDSGIEDYEYYDLGTLTEDWQEFSVDYYKPLMTNCTVWPYIYIAVDDDSSYILDEISLESAGNMIYNGNFSGDIDTYWIATNAVIELSDDVPAESSSSTSLHVTETGRNGRVAQYINIEPGTEYKLAFWAKGVSTEAEGGIDGLAMVPTFDTYSKDRTYERIENSDLTFTSEWKHYEINYTTKADREYLPLFYIVTGTKYNHKTEYYITDIVLEKTASGSGGDGGSESGQDVYDTPEIRNVNVDGLTIVNQTINISCEYLGKNEKTGVVNLFKQAKDGGWASIMACELTDLASYTFRKEDAGQNLKLLIIPMDIEGQIGGYRETELGRIYDTLEIEADFTSTLGTSVSAEVNINNYGDTMDIVGMLLLFDEENACVGSTYQHSNTSFNESDMLSLSVQNPGNAVSARVFIWEGTSDINTTMVSLYDSLVLTN